MFHAGRPLEAASSARSPFYPVPNASVPSHDEPRLELRSLFKSFGGKPVVEDASLSVRPGSIHGIIGRSGAGKSTLLRMAALLETPDSGVALYGGTPVSGLAGRDRLLARRRAGVVFQSFNLFASRTAAGNVAFPLESAGVPKAAVRERVAMLLDLVGLADKADRPVGRFSGGEKQRVAIARALVNRPEILFCDEATSALDPETTRSVLDLILSLRDRLGLTVLMVTHQMEVVRRACDDVAVMEAGRIVETGTVESLFSSPRTRSAKRLVAGLLPLAGGRTGRWRRMQVAFLGRVGIPARAVPSVTRVPRRGQYPPRHHTQGRRIALGRARRHVPGRRPCDQGRQELVNGSRHSRRIDGRRGDRPCLNCSTCSYDRRWRP